MVKQIRDDMFKYANKHNKTCNIVIGKETFKEVQKEAHPDRLKAWSFKEYEEKNMKPTIMGADFIEGDFDFGYYIIGESK